MSRPFRPFRDVLPAWYLRMMIGAAIVAILIPLS
jgi:hypothetical protein